MILLFGLDFLDLRYAVFSSAGRRRWSAFGVLVQCGEAE